jgi:Saccharopine dehydrogenase NADP binding domain
VVGGYGASGALAAAQLARLPGAEVLIGGRDIEKAKAAAERMGKNVSAARVDVFDDRSLGEFCARCSTVIHCGGPVSVLQDRVAQAAWSRRCNYVDIAGLSIVRGRMSPHHDEMERAGLACVVSAGWLPGLTELTTVYAHARARAAMGEIESVTAFFGDSGEWSENAMRDIAWHMRRSGLPKAECFRKGERMRTSMKEGSVKADLGEPVGNGRFSSFWIEEMREVGARLRDCDVYSFSYVPGMRAAMTVAMVATLPMSNDRAVRMLSGALRGHGLRVGGFVVVKVLSRSGRTATVRLSFGRGEEYRITGMVPALVARMIGEGAVRPGVRFLADAVDAEGFVAELRTSGFEVSEDFSGAASVTAS